MKERINQYTCRDCKESTVTVDVDEGVTPMFLACRATPDCKGTMASAMYRGNQTHPREDRRGRAHHLHDDQKQT